MTPHYCSRIFTFFCTSCENLGEKLQLENHLSCTWIPCAWLPAPHINTHAHTNKQSGAGRVSHVLVDICWHLALISFLYVTFAEALSMSHHPQTSRASNLASTDTIHHHKKRQNRSAETHQNLVGHKRFRRRAFLTTEVLIYLKHMSWIKLLHFHSVLSNLKATGLSFTTRGSNWEYFCASKLSLLFLIFKLIRSATIAQHVDAHIQN